MRNEYWQLAMYCAAVAAGTGCRAGEIRNLKLEDIDLFNGKIRISRKIAKNRKERHPRLMALAEWGMRHLLSRAALVVLAFRLANEHAALVALEFTCVFQRSLHLSASAVQPHLDRG